MPSKQLKALDETIAYIKEEGKTRDYHCWDTDDCPLCEAFKIGCWNCRGCPFNKFNTPAYYGCTTLARKKGYKNYSDVPIPTILRYLRRFRKGYKG